MKVALVLIAALIPATAFAAPPAFEVIDRTDAVEIIARGVHASSAAVFPVRSRLEVPILGNPRIERLNAKDATVRQVELAGSSEDRKLSIKLQFERSQVKQLARHARSIQIGDDLHVLLPRTVPADGVSITLPEPTVPRVEPEIATPPQSIAPPAAIETPAAAPQVATTAGLPTVDPRREPEAPWSKLTMYGVFGLAAAGLAAWMARRRRGALAAPPAIEVVAQRALGGRAKVVWLTAGGRDMVVAVTPQQVRMLGQWRKQEKREKPELPSAQVRADARRDRPERSEPAASPAVAGILRLRERTTPSILPLSEEIATCDLEADALWAKEILSAKGARR